MTEREVQQSEAASSGQTPSTVERLANFRKELIAQGIDEGQASAMMFRLFDAYINGDLTKQGLALGDVC